jgi:putative transcriptional regulator
MQRALSQLGRITLLGQPDVSNLIRELRQLTGLTQGQFADALGLAFCTVNRWENGHIQPSRLALRQVELLLQTLANSAEGETQQRAQTLLDRYFH